MPDCKQTTAGLHDNIRLELTYRPIESIKPNARDPRTYSRAETRRVAKAVQTFGAMPLIVTSDLTLISGNIWLEAALVAGVSQLPIVVADHLTPAQADAFMIAQSRLIERGEWDERLLGEILRDLTVQELDFELEVTGFDVPEIDILIEGLGVPGDEPDPADELPPTGPAVSRQGDIWILDGHRIFCGDALKPESFATVLGEERAAVVFTDPPYNVPILGNVSGLGKVKHRDFQMASGEMTEAQFTAFLGGPLSLCAEWSVDGSLHYICMDWRHAHELIVTGRRVYDQQVNLCVWTKTNAGMGSFYRSQHELVFVFRKGRGPHRNNVQLGRFGRSRTNVWTYPGANTFGRNGEEGDLLALHPTVKPVALVADVLLDASARGEIVLDPFFGSGSTAIAAEKVGRRAAGIEIDPLYVDIAIRRWERWTGQSARLANDGRTFSEIQQDRVQEGGNGN